MSQPSGPETTPPPISANQPRPDLRSVVTHAEAEAERLLDTAGTAPLDVVAWLSAHIAAMERAVYPVARDDLPDGQQILARLREITGRLTRTLRVVERRHSGDVLASGLSSERLFQSLRALVDEYHVAENQLVDRLVDTLSPPAQADLIMAYETALEHAPTRPHPHLHRGGLMFRLDGLRDRILDAMDGRHVPVPRLVKAHIAPGRWGSYLLGQPHEEDRDAG
jgi:hypothetical protein